MAERDQLMRALGRHDAGDAGGAEHVALLGVALEHEIERLLRHHDAALGDRDALGAALADTSTMRASPPLPRWVRALALASRVTPRRRGRGASRAQQRAGGGRDVGLAHQALADQEGRDADAASRGEIGRREDAALADHDAIRGISGARRSLVASVVSKVFRSRLLMPISGERGAARGRARARRALRAARPCRARSPRPRVLARRASSTAAMMIRMQSAPQARASTT